MQPIKDILAKINVPNKIELLVQWVDILQK